MTIPQHGEGVAIGNPDDTGRIIGLSRERQEAEEQGEESAHGTSVGPNAGDGKRNQKSRICPWASWRRLPTHPEQPGENMNPYNYINNIQFHSERIICHDFARYLLTQSVGRDILKSSDDASVSSNNSTPPTGSRGRRSSSWEPAMLHVVAMMSTLMTLGADDPIKTSLDASRASYQEKVKAETDKLFKAIDGLLVGFTGTTAETIRSQREAFQNDKNLIPTAPQLQTHVSAYNTELALAKDEWRKSLEKARDEYKKINETTKSNIINKELDELNNTRRMLKPKQKQQKVAKQAKILPGMRWAGIKVWTEQGGLNPPGTKQEISLSITGVDGNTFRGVFNWTNNRRGPVPVIGKFDADNIQWSGDGEPLAEYQARFVDNSIKGKCDNGTFVISRIQ